MDRVRALMVISRSVPEESLLLRRAVGLRPVLLFPLSTSPERVSLVIRKRMRMLVSQRPSGPINCQKFYII